MSFSLLFLSLIVGCSPGNSSITKSQSQTPSNSPSPNNSAVGQVHVKSPGSNDEESQALDCNDPKGYSVDEVRDSEANYVKIVRGPTVLHTIQLPTGEERNGFGFNWAKKTKEGFEIGIEYGSRFYYEKRFAFICKQHNFYLNKVRVTSFDKNSPANSKTKVIKMQPVLPLEKFSISAFMLEGTQD